MNWVDVLVLVLALLAGISGARQGMVTAAASFIGVLTGAVIEKLGFVHALMHKRQT